MRIYINNDRIKNSLPLLKKSIKNFSIFFNKKNKFLLKLKAKKKIIKI